MAEERDSFTKEYIGNPIKKATVARDAANEHEDARKDIMRQMDDGSLK